MFIHFTFLIHVDIIKPQVNIIILQDDISITHMSTYQQSHVDILDKTSDKIFASRMYDI